MAVIHVTNWWMSSRVQKLCNSGSGIARTAGLAHCVVGRGRLDISIFTVWRMIDIFLDEEAGKILEKMHHCRLLSKRKEKRST